MNLKEAKKIRPGAIVREAWATTNRTGLVLSKTHIEEDHVAKVLCHKKEQRYDILVHWLEGPREVAWSHKMENPETMQNWELMVVSHT